MKLRTKLFAGGALLLGLSSATAAMAASDARTTADLNIRVGPGVEYGYIDTIPEGTIVPVYGCISDYDWCEVGFDGLRGWVSASYLMAPGHGYYYSYAPQIGVPIITFSFGDYHDRWYRDRPWYKHRHWAGRWHHRVDAQERREDRREARQDRREERRDAKQERREERREVRQERREERRDARREERREFRQDRREDRREARRDERRIEQRQRSRDQDSSALRTDRPSRSGDGPRFMENSRSPRQ